jgi:peptidase E
MPYSATVSGHILAIGGGGVLSPGSKLERQLLELSGKPRPLVAYLPTATADSDEPIALATGVFGRRECELDVVTLFGMPEGAAERVAAADVVYVNGGNTANMLAIWRVHGVDRALREVWQRGGVLGGWSAGANCWFEDSVTDSFGPRLRELGAGLGLLPGSFCPHYDTEVERRGTYTRLVREGILPSGYAADDDAAFHFAGTELREVVSQRDGARGYRVTPDGEEPLEARQL